ncbi:hypothetical protein [Neisseria yangbaofengii]|uniref:hypothetical protein n=1 Tax=Neisseria yangbaofengii TaxID=2709396 RepID=UPI0013ED47E9|nr:hypothetical protein [Neisseria yangbaofengii]
MSSSMIELELCELENVQGGALPAILFVPAAKLIYASVGTAAGAGVVGYGLARIFG